MSFDSQTESSRRTFLRRVGVAAGATTTLAAGNATAQSEPDYGDWFSSTDNHDGTYDYTGKQNVTVSVGTNANGGAFGFSPTAIRVDPGTTVTWEWTGQGGSHNVVDQDGNFQSDLLSEQGATFEHAFESEGTFKYACEPHMAMGMKGAVVVGGSGGKDPSQLEQSGSGGSGGSGGGSDGGSGGNGMSEGAMQFGMASMASTIVIGLLSPVLFAVVLFFKKEDGDLD